MKNMSKSVFFKLESNPSFQEMLSSLVSADLVGTENVQHLPEGIQDRN